MVKAKPWEKSSWFGCSFVEAYHANYLTLEGGDPQLWKHNFVQPKMNHRTEDIDTCTYIKKNKLFQINVRVWEFRAETVFFVVGKQLTSQQGKNYADDLPTA